MSRIPFFPQASVRDRSDPTPSASDRRATDAAKDTFAASLATARTDRVPAHLVPTRTAATVREQVRDALYGDRAATGRDDDAAMRAPSGAQQRASVQALMLSGAMKYAVTRKDAPETATLPNPVASQPAMDDTLACAAPSSIAVADAATADLMSEVPADQPGASPTRTASAAQPQDVTIALTGEAALQAMPAMIAIPEETTALTPTVTTDRDVDLSSSNAATAAARQLIAQLPIPELAATQPPVQDLPSDSTLVAPSHSIATSAPFGSAIASQPAQSDATLVEDHFDAPASALADSATTTPIATPSPGRVAQPPAATADAGTATPASATARRTDLPAMQANVTALDPAFRDRLEKVIDRMRDEFGRTVTVVETARSQTRQEALFAQGRTTPGPIVTWTKNSKHGKGLAADLLVDGSWQNSAGYAELAAAAKQEGLRTLGARDPGHVELPTDGAVSGETLGTLLNELQGDAGDATRRMRADVSGGGSHEARAAMLTQVANVAQVARVATVAQVARVAGVARPGASASQPAVTSDAVSPLAVTGVSNLATTSDAAAAMRVATPTTAVNMADRISHLMDLQATQDARPLSSVLLRLDNANGIEDQIRIDTRGTNVDARLGLGNVQQAAVLTDRLGELRDALERRGLSADGVRVQVGTSRSADSVTLSKPAAQAIELAALRAASDSQAHGNTRDQSSRDQQLQREALARETARHTPRSSSDDARQRSRRGQPEDRR